MSGRMGYDRMNLAVGQRQDDGGITPGHSCQAKVRPHDLKKFCYDTNSSRRRRA